MSLTLLIDGDSFIVVPTPPPPPEGPVPYPLGPIGTVIYNAMAPNWIAADPANRYAMMTMIGAICGPAESIVALARDSDDGPGWSAMLDIDRCPDDFLDFLGQFVGVPPAGDLFTGDVKRQRVRAEEGFQRGTFDDLRSKAQRNLTGDRQVEITNPYLGDRWKVRVITFRAQTPDSDQTLADMLPLPAGFRLYYDVFDGESYAELAAAYRTDRDVDSHFTTYEDIRTKLPH